MDRGARFQNRPGAGLAAHGAGHRVRSFGVFGGLWRLVNDRCIPARGDGDGVGSPRRWRHPTAEAQSGRARGHLGSRTRRHERGKAQGTQSPVAVRSARVWRAWVYAVV